VPAPYAALYNPDTTALPLHSTLDHSIDPIAWTAFSGLGGITPFNRTNTDAQVRAYRAAYYAAVSWGDYVAGKLLDKLKELELNPTTAVVMHSDHGCAVLYLYLFLFLFLFLYLFLFLFLFPTNPIYL
jgi:hypothetical protein